MKKLLAIMLALIMVLALVPTVAFAEEPKTIYVDATMGDDTNNGSKDNPYKTVEAAAKAAASGDTIMLGEGNYTLYGVSSDSTTKGKNLTFIGQGFDKTTWNIGTGTADAFGQGNGDFSFNGSGTIEFQNMTLKAAVISGTGEQVDRNYTGFAHTTNTIVKNCTVNGKTFYWGYTSATFKNTTFNAPEGDYAIWTYCSPTMTFDGCKFNVSGKAINVYRESGKFNVEVNYKDCSVVSTKDGKAVMNINDSLMGNSKFTINISGKNSVTGLTSDDLNKEYKKEQEDITCSKLFEFNMKYGDGNTGKTIVNIDGITVWKDGKMVSHAIDTANDKYTDGYKDNAFDIDSIGEWTLQTGTNTYTRNISRTCRYCGYSERIIETKQEEYVPPYNPTPVQPVQPVQPAPLPPQTGDMPLWYAVAQFLGLVK